MFLYGGKAAYELSCLSDQLVPAALPGAMKRPSEHARRCTTIYSLEDASAYAWNVSRAVPSISTDDSHNRGEAVCVTAYEMQKRSYVSRCTYSCSVCSLSFATDVQSDRV